MYNHSTIDAKQCIETMADRLQARQISTWDCPHCDKVPQVDVASRQSAICAQDQHILLCRHHTLVRRTVIRPETMHAWLLKGTRAKRRQRKPMKASQSK